MARKLDAERIEQARHKSESTNNRREEEKQRIQETIAKNRRGERKGRVIMPERKEYAFQEAPKVRVAAYCRVSTAEEAQVGSFEMGDDGLLCKGVLIRHLVLPGAIENTLDVIDYVAENHPGERVLFSLMSQFTPTANCPAELTRPLTQEEYDRCLDYLSLSGIECGFVQEICSGGTEMIPAFDLSGVEPIL